jgi:hypothetical protein
MSSSNFGRWLFLNWPKLYVKTGAAVWLGKAGRDTKEDLDNLTENQHYIKNDILPLTGYNLLYYSPNVLFWPVNFAIDGYQWGVIKYYENRVAK